MDCSSSVKLRNYWQIRGWGGSRGPTWEGAGSLWGQFHGEGGDSQGLRQSARVFYSFCFWILSLLSVFVSGSLFSVMGKIQAKKSVTSSEMSHELPGFWLSFYYFSTTSSDGQWGRAPWELEHDQWEKPRMGKKPQLNCVFSVDKDRWARPGEYYVCCRNAYWGKAWLRKLNFFKSYAKPWSVKTLQRTCSLIVWEHLKRRWARKGHVNRIIDRAELFEAKDVDGIELELVLVPAKWP